MHVRVLCMHIKPVTFTASASPDDALQVLQKLGLQCKGLVGDETLRGSDLQFHISYCITRLNTDGRRNRLYDRLPFANVNKPLMHNSEIFRTCCACVRV